MSQESNWDNPEQNPAMYPSQYSPVPDLFTENIVMPPVSMAVTPHEPSSDFNEISNDWSSHHLQTSNPSSFMKPDIDPCQLYMNETPDQGTQAPVIFQSNDCLDVIQGNEHVNVATEEIQNSGIEYRQTYTNFIDAMNNGNAVDEDATGLKTMVISRRFGYKLVLLKDRLRYICCGCRSGFQTVDAFLEHWKYRHVSRDSQNREDGAPTYEEQREDQGHLKRIAFKCLFCEDFMSKHKENVVQHIRYAHNRNPNFPCTFCYQSFGTEEELQIHCIDQHGNECQDEQGRIFTNMYSM